MFQLRNRIELLQSISGDDYDQDYLITKKEKEVLTFIIKNPGLSHKELALSLKMKPSALTNKIKILKEHFLVQSIKLGRNVYYYINCKFLENNPTFLLDYQEQKSTLVDNEKILLDIKNKLLENIPAHEYDQGYLTTKKEKEVLTFISKNPGLCHKELALSLRMTPSALDHKLKILKKHFLVQSIKLGRNVYYYANCKFLENNPTFLSSYQTERKESLIDNEKQIFSYLKNILIFSSSVHSKLLLDHLDFFQLFFSIYELIHLINLLDIYRLDIDPSFSNLNLLKLKDENFQNINKKELLIKYKIVCLYLSNEYNDQKVRTMK